MYQSSSFLSNMTWHKLLSNCSELQLVGTLNGGQSFRWTFQSETGEWLGVFKKTVWKLRQSDKGVDYKVIGTLLGKNGVKNGKKSNTEHKEDIDFKKLLEDYFRLDVNLGKYYKEWSEKDELFKSACSQFYGIRMLNQDPIENIFSFICSQNNHISRISSMVEKLCTHYGEEICQHDSVTYYTFPEVEKLAAPEVESHLRELGFGYRAKFIQTSAGQVAARGGAGWCGALRGEGYAQARAQLMTLHGIGPKVADCICLMSLGHLSALPVDTHVYQIACTYLPHLRGRKSVTERVYTEIGDHFRGLYGDMAGWAHTILFCADLKKFQQNGSEEVKSKEVAKKGKQSRKRKCS